MAILKCSCGSKRFIISIDIPLVIMVDENRELQKVINHEEYYDELGENIINCAECNREIKVDEGDEL